MSTATTKSTQPQLDQLTINTIRTLSMDAVQQANCGHPGTPMALAPVTYELWQNHLSYDPATPAWPNRDRFVLSCGHASMLLYSILHLADVRHGKKQPRPSRHDKITLEDIRNFRQLGSPCAGHPEYGDAPGIETTTGPLGQGIGNSVGMAAAAQWLAARYNRPGYELFDYNVYAMCSDGDLMEGIGCEAASLAGHLALPNLCWIYDDNHITIEGKTDLAFSEDVATRFEGLGFNAIRVADANDLTALGKALKGFEATKDRPTIIIVRSTIAWGSPNKADTAGAHGSPLGEEEIKLTKQTYGWPAEEKFLVPPEVKSHLGEGVAARGMVARQEWDERFAAYAEEFPEEGRQLKEIWSGVLPDGWDHEIPDFPPDEKGMATRISSGKVLNAIAPRFPWLLGGSADLAPSTKTLIESEDAGHFAAHSSSVGDYAGRNFHFGVREHAMASFANGMALTGLRPYTATFFTFTDYMRPAMRLAAIMRQPVLYVLTHDSIGLGEDGPTHQPVEHLAACRAIPELIVVRPADAAEVAEAYRTVLSLNDRPAALVLSRQNLPTIDRDRYASASGAGFGAYVLADAAGGDPEVILIGTGSEIPICLTAYHQLLEEGIRARVVSMPSWELFDDHDQQYRESVLPEAVTARVAVEAGIAQGWEKYLGSRGRFVGLKSFGASAPFEELYEHFGITPDRVVAEAKAALGR